MFRAIHRAAIAASVVLILESTLAPAAPAAPKSASPRAPAARLVRIDMLAWLQSASSAPNQCISYQYDKNGNLIVKTSGTFGATNSWGSASFGCFAWTPAN